MHFLQHIAIPLLLTISISANAELFELARRGGPRSGSPCMTDDQANQVGSLWTQLIGNYTKALAEAVLTADFTDYSNSALSLNAVCPQVQGQAPPLLSPVFSSRSQFEAGQGSQPPIDSTVLQVWNGCTSATMRYKMTNLGSRPVVGVIAIETEKATSGSYPYLLKTIYSEFDSEAWVENLKDAGAC